MVGLTITIGLVVDVVDEQALLHADLRRGQAGAVGVVHGVEHVVGQAGDGAVDVGDLGAPAA